MASERTESGRDLRDLRALLRGDLRPILVTVRSRPSRWSPLDTAAEGEARSMRYRLARDGAQVELVLDPRDEPHLRRRWDGSRPRYLDGLVVRIVDLRVSSLLRQRSGAPDRASYVPTSERLDSGTIFRFRFGLHDVVTATYEDGRLVEGPVQSPARCGSDAR